MTVQIITGDCRDVLKTLPDQSVHCVVTSPPYFGLRDYGMNGQMGLEPTPSEFVASLVSVFREVRRVLRDDGTLWLNLGDSYAGSWGNAGGAARGSGSQRTINRGSLVKDQAERNGNFVPPAKYGFPALGVKPKDLIGIPWRVAFALQQPWYSGRIKDERDRIWLAAMIDGEGCFYIHKRPSGQHAGDGYHRTQDSYQAAFEVANTNEAIVARCLAITGRGSVIRQDKDRRQPLFRWTVRSNEAREIAREIYPHLVAKQQQARIVCGIPPSGKDAEAGWNALKLLHAGTVTDVDFPVPASMFEPGWYLRQDVIWSKPNPMPESVRDRCTKAHEYVFLLSKSPRYYFDAEAIAEQAVKGAAGSRFDAGKTAVHQLERASNREREEHETRNKRDVWTVPTRGFKGAHFATFPEALIEPSVLAGCPEGGTVLDPFAGAGTTGLVADRLQRNAILIELNSAYAGLARRRINQDAGMFGAVA